MLPSIYFLLFSLFGAETKAVKIEKTILRVPEVKGLNLEFAARSKDYRVLAFLDRTAKTFCFLFSEKSSIYLWNYGPLGYQRVHIADFSTDDSEIIYMYSFQKIRRLGKEISNL